MGGVHKQALAFQQLHGDLQVDIVILNQKGLKTRQAIMPFIRRDTLRGLFMGRRKQFYKAVINRGLADRLRKHAVNIAIRQAVAQVAADMQITSGQIRVNDRGALECTLKARVETAL